MAAPPLALRSRFGRHRQRRRAPSQCFRRLQRHGAGHSARPRSASRWGGQAIHWATSSSGPRREPHAPPVSRAAATIFLPILYRGFLLARVTGALPRRPMAWRNPAAGSRTILRSPFWLERENGWSVAPSRARFRVKCFSTATAPHRVGHGRHGDAVVVR